MSLLLLPLPANRVAPNKRPPLFVSQTNWCDHLNEIFFPAVLTCDDFVRGALRDPLLISTLVSAIDDYLLETNGRVALTANQTWHRQFGERLKAECLVWQHAGFTHINSR